MQALKYLVTIPLCILLLISCTKELNYSPTMEPITVVNSILVDNKPFGVHLSSITSMLSEYPTDTNTYELLLYEDTLLMLNTEVTEGWYQSDVMISPGYNYHLIIHGEGETSIICSDSIPPPFYLDAVEMIYPAGLDKNGEPFYQFNVTLSDPPNQKDFYEIIIRTGKTSFDFFHNAYKNIVTTEPVLLNEGDVDYGPTSFFFSDELFDGQTYTLQLKAINGNGNADDLEKNCIIRHVSESYYLYRKYYTRHAYNQQLQGDFWTTLFLSEPQNMYTNVQNGYGIFAGYSETKMRIYE